MNHKLIAEVLASDAVAPVASFDNVDDMLAWLNSPVDRILTRRELKRHGWTDQDIDALVDLIHEEKCCCSPQ